jgi:hypothetical protein
MDLNVPLSGPRLSRWAIALLLLLAVAATFVARLAADGTWAAVARAACALAFAGSLVLFALGLPRRDGGPP